MQFKRALKQIARISILTLVLPVLAAAPGCDDLYGGYGYGYGWEPLYPTDGWSPSYDWQTVQSVNDYRQDVFYSASDAWDSYIRGE